MRSLPSMLALLVGLICISPAYAEDAQTQTLGESVKEKTQPLLKALSLIGTPYKFGGNNPEKGLDCSGLVKHVYKETANINLPRNAADMSRQGEQVSRAELKPGDLVFFNTRRRPNSHVGIYAGEGTFVHASSSQSKKVMLSRMGDQYWATRFNGARRVLPTE